jgi:APA family basic amino acid/polyamine antiporter
LRTFSIFPSLAQKKDLLQSALCDQDVDLELKKELGLATAILVVVASMIGTGIFITTGTVLDMARNSSTVLLLWFSGGIVAVTGCLCYAELATMWPHVGGEYLYLKNSFGFLPSFLTGWISLVVGFSASVAISAITFVEYLNQFMKNFMDLNGFSFSFLDGPWTQKFIAAFIILIFGGIHIHGVKLGSRIQNVLTLLKLVIVVSLIALGFTFADWSKIERLTQVYPAPPSAEVSGIPGMGLVLLIIMFSYSGWNGASYITGELKDPHKFLPRALFFGTLLTMVLYLALNVVFLISAPGEEIMGKEAVGVIATKNLFGPHVSIFFTLAIALILLSSISVEMMIGPRVYYAMARDRMIFGMLSRIHPTFRTPSISVLIQILLAVLYVFIGSAKFLMEYMGFALGIFPILTVIGLVYMRIKHPDIPRPFRVPLYPLTPLVFIFLSTGMMVTGFMTWTATSQFALFVLFLGVAVFYIWRFFLNRSQAETGSDERAG